MTTLRIGIRSHDEAKARMLALAGGQAKRDPDEPTVWVSSLASLAQVLSEDNQALLRLIGERRPNSLTELAALSGRALSNLSRTLSTMESYGLVEMVEIGRAKAPRLTCDHIEIVMPALAHDVAAE
ncbi:MAG: helix-turn-helix domain-containing protein [Magnetospirillum sp.]|nr:helix-turn-helix domain-containing protein [Magnetospirillum sp.]